MQRLNTKRWKMIFQENGIWKKAGVAVLFSENIDFKPKLIKRDKESHYILANGTKHQSDITIINTYAINIGGINEKHNWM
jgi:hypothetical protein